MRSIFNNVELISRRVARPPVAVEIAANGVLAAALPAIGQDPVHAFESLPPEILVPGIAEPNLRSQAPVVAAIRSTLNQVCSHSQAVTLVIPDLSVRVFLLDFDSLPRDDAAALTILRFRLRKVVPFDLEHARLSYQVLSKDDSGCKVLVAVIPGPILEEYEAAVRAAEYEPGAVLSSGLAALAALNSHEPELTACLGDRSLTTSITRGNELLLYRTRDLALDPALRLAEAKRDIAVASAYFEDKLTSRPQRLFYTGITSTEEFARAVAGPGMKVIDLAPRPQTGSAIPLANPAFAAVAGALAGAR
jgi:type IV pilus assembly protein PilM